LKERVAMRLSSAVRLSVGMVLSDYREGVPPPIAWR
jgi:hypothetical protein